MRMQWRAVVAAAAGAVVAASVAAAAMAMPKTLLSGPLYGNIPDVTIRGVDAGALPWVVKGSVVLTTTELTAKGSWLVVPAGPDAAGKPVPKAAVGTTVGVKSVAAAVSCAGYPLAVTKAVALSADGKFAIHAALKTDEDCADPIVLIGPPGTTAGTLASWFASSDFLRNYGSATPAMIKAWSHPAASTSTSTTTGTSTWG